MVRRYVSQKDYDAVWFLPNQRNISTLTLLVSVHLNPVNPANPHAKEGQFVAPNFSNPGTPGPTYIYQRWGAAEWENFKTGYKREIESFLNWPRMGLWLQPSSLGIPESAEELKEFTNPRPISPRFRPFVQCALTVTLVPTKQQSHVSYDVLRLRDDQPFFRAYDSVHNYARDGGALTNRSLQPWPPQTSHEKHSTIAHELGHSLNLDHINSGDVRCVLGSEDICYGRRGTPKRRNLMGAGNEITKDNAMPWLRAMYWLTTALIWDATDQMPREMYFFE